MAGGGNLLDGLGAEEVVIGSAVNLGAQNPYFTGSITSDSTIADTDGRLVSSVAGSPSEFGQLVQGGTGSLSAGSAAWVVFNTAFSAAPDTMVAGYNDHTPGACTVGSLVAGSALVEGVTASKTFNWIAIGAR